MSDFKLSQKAYIYNINTRIYNYYLPKLSEGSPLVELAQENATYNILDILSKKDANSQYIIAPDFEGLRLKVTAYIDSQEKDGKLSKRDADFQRYRCQTLTIYDVQRIN